jgi:hypothetical protein
VRESRTGCTSVALQTSFSVLQRAIPSGIAAAISSMYFSSASWSMSFRIRSRFSAPMVSLMRLMNAVCRLSDESRAFAFPVWVRMVHYVKGLRDIRSARTSICVCSVELLEQGTLVETRALLVSF